MRLVLTTTCLIPLLAACTVGPDYKAPQVPVSQQFVAGASASIPDAGQHQWWRSFNDSYLNALVERGISQNLDIKSALSRIEQAEAQLAGTGFFGNLSGSLNSSQTYTDSTGGSSNVTNSSSLSASYVFDFFGGSRRNQEQALANLEGAGFDAGSAKLAFLASLTANYITARYNQEAMAFTRRSLATREETLSLVQQQRDVGAASQLALVQARASYESAQADLPGYAAGFEAAVFAIATLLAEPAGPLMAQMQRGAPQPLPSGLSNFGVPADLLRNIPSVRSAERDLAAATAAVGVAEAALYPSIQLSGTFTVSDTTSWSYGPSLSLPIFSQTALRAQRDASIETARQAEFAYRSVVLDAVEDVEVAASSLRRTRQQIAAIRRSVASNDEALSLSQETYEAGALTLLDLLDTERTTSSQRLSLAAARRNLANDWVSLQIATGRGWK